MGMASGYTHVIHSPKEIGKIKSGEVMVTEMTTPDFVPAMRKASAIVTDKGGQTSHAAIVSREMGVPCVVGTGNATKILSKGRVVTVNGKSGEIFDGAADLVGQLGAHALELGQLHELAELLDRRPVPGLGADEDPRPLRAHLGGRRGVLSGPDRRQEAGGQ